MNKEFKLKTTITEIEEKYDKNMNRFYKVWITWEFGKPKVFYAFSMDFNLKETTLQTLTTSPQTLTNQQVLNYLPRKGKPRW